MSAAGKHKGEPILVFADAAGWGEWLAGNHAAITGVWLRFLRKRHPADRPFGHDDALIEALCWGWIDGQTQSVDETAWLQRFTPRRKKSRWSKINCAHAERLIAEGRMQPRGQAEVDAAKADGRWEAAYASPTNMTVPDDLRAALDASPAAAKAFAGLKSINRYAILYRIEDAKRPDTRARRVAMFAAMLAKGETPYPQ